MKIKTLGLSGKKWLTRLEKGGFYVSYYAKSMLLSPDFKSSKGSGEYVIKTPADLGFTSYPTTTQLFDEANLAKYGLELCSPEVCPALLETKEITEWTSIAMKTITDSNGYPRVFRVARYGDGELWLFSRWTYPNDEWNLDYRIVFRLRKGTQSSDVSPKALDIQTLALKIEQAKKLLEEVEELLKSND